MPRVGAAIFAEMFVSDATVSVNYVVWPELRVIE